MKSFKNFYFEKYAFDKQKLVASFSYSFDMEEFFVEEIYFSNSNFEVKSDLYEDDLDVLLFNIHLILGISYYKLCPTSNLVIKTGNINKNQMDFWKKLYKNGLGEFFIKNDINPNGLINFVIFKGNLKEKKSNIKIDSNKSILMWGGGKDSIVSSIILDDKNLDFTPYIFGKLDRIKESTLNVLGKKHLLIKRKLSENLFRLNDTGYYNGHVPITSIIAFTSLLSAYIYGYKNIILSNEKSASEHNTIWSGLKVNHQYSKGGEFENDFSEYVKKYISNDFNYYSILKDKYEYEISSIFANKAQKYFDVFSSCNNNFKIEKQALNNTRWCNKCEKCCFVYLILSPFIDEKDMYKIFGNSLFENKELLNIFISLIGYGKNKPFECVGTYEECLISILDTINNYKNKIKSGEIKKLPYILEEIELLIGDKIKELDIDSIKNKLIGK